MNPYLLCTVVAVQHGLESENLFFFSCSTGEERVPNLSEEQEEFKWYWLWKACQEYYWWGFSSSEILCWNGQEWAHDCAVDITKHLTNCCHRVLLPSFLLPRHIQEIKSDKWGT